MRRWPAAWVEWAGWTTNDPHALIRVRRAHADGPDLFRYALRGASNHLCGVWVFITGGPLSDVHGSPCLLVAGGGPVIALGWQFVKGRKLSR
jgi:hypothetical protein